MITRIHVTLASTTQTPILCQMQTVYCVMLAHIVRPQPLMLPMDNVLQVTIAQVDPSLRRMMLLLLDQTLLVINVSPENIAELDQRHQLCVTLETFVSLTIWRLFLDYVMLDITVNLEQSWLDLKIWL